MLFRSKIEADLDLLAALRDAGVRRIALRASVLQPNLQSALGDFIDRLLETQGQMPSQPPAAEQAESSTLQA